MKTKREKVILIALLVVVAAAGIYYAYDAGFFGGGGAQQAVVQVDVQELEADVAQANSVANQHQLRPEEEQRLTKAEIKWSQDPIYVRPDVAGRVVDPVSQSECERLFNYNGASVVGDSSFAVINDYEYEVGYEIKSGVERAPTGYYVAAIYSDRVVIGQLDENDIIVEQCEVYLMMESVEPVN